MPMVSLDTAAFTVSTQFTDGDGVDITYGAPAAATGVNTDTYGYDNLRDALNVATRRILQLAAADWDMESHFMDNEQLPIIPFSWMGTYEMMGEMLTCYITVVQR